MVPLIRTQSTAGNFPCVYAEIVDLPIELLDEKYDADLTQ